MTWQTWGSKQALEKRRTSLSLMEVLEHAWDFVGRKINQRNPKCQNIDELRTAILQEWQQFSQERLRRLVRSMTRRVPELHTLH
jgi:iron-sulfur cluster repair protein YtfE (RIC family)